MNHIYRSIWNASTGTVTAVSEHAKRGGKKTSRAGGAVVSSGFVLKSVSVAVALACGSAGHASPTGGTVVAGDASITSVPGNTTIHQTSQNAALNWQSFDIGVTDAVRFVQPNSNAVALNRVLGADPSSILGSLSSNGKVFLINPNGILFGAGAQVNVGGLIASTRTLTDSDFLAGRYEFSGDSAAGVVNHGSINADGGYVALLGANVSNQGVIAAKMGSVVLAAGNVLTLDVAGDGLLNVSVNAGAVDALVQSGGLIQADGGQVLLTARSASDLLPSAVNNTGMIRAQTIENRSGTIKLLGDMHGGAVNVAGILDASAPNGGDGGFIDTSAAQVNVAGDTKVTSAAAQGLTGSWLIDPTDYTIAASGGDITGAVLSSNLVSTNVTIQSISGGAGTAGDVNVNDTVTWSANRLTLNAQNNVNINTAMHASGTASLALEYGQGALAAGNTSRVNVNAPVNLPAGNNFSMRLGSNGTVVNYVVITSLGAAGSTTGADLQGMSGSLAGKYVLGSNIDAAATSTWNAGAGFAPVGTNATRFTGIFDGLGHTVSGLTLNRTGANPAALFGVTAIGSIVRNVGLIGGSVLSDSWGAGALVGLNSGTVSNSYATGTVSGYHATGGLVGTNDGVITGSYATGLVSSYALGEAGGLVGWNAGPGTISNSYATGNASSPGSNVGGLVGINYGSIANSHATGSATGTEQVGGLTGRNRSTIDGSYATGAVTATGNYGGGLVGLNNAGGVSNSYATGAVTGDHLVGGLAGAGHGTFTNNYATGAVTATGNSVGGLLGSAYGTVSNNYATGAVSGDGRVGGLIGYNNYGIISNNYATGAVSSGGNYVGGLVGFSYYGTISNTYATGAVSGGGSYVGGLLGYNDHGDTVVVASYWNITTSGQASSAGGAGLTTVQMRTPANFAGFNFTTTPGAAGNNWVMVNVDGTLNNAADATGGTRPMLASEYSTTITNAHQLQLMRMDLAANYILANNIELAAELASASGIWGGAGFAPIGSPGAQFTGTFDGLGHTIGGLTINQPTRSYVGLFGVTGTTAIVRNVGLIGGSVIGDAYVGSLVGRNGGVLSNSFATTNVSGTAYVGGLVGYMVAGGTIDNAYAAGTVTALRAGGLVGRNEGTISNSYATGAVSGDYSSGLTGLNDGGGIVVRSFWNTETTGRSTSTAGIGLTTIQMMQLASFGSWNAATANTIANTGGSGAVWRIYEGHSAPLLTRFMAGLTLTGAPDVAATYNGNTQSGASIAAPSGVLGAAATGINAGFYNGYYSSQLGYDITGGNLTIGKADLLLSGTRIYDGTSVVASSVLTVTGVAGETFAITGSGDTSNLASKNVQAGSTLASVTGLVLGAGANGGIASNYNTLSTAGSSMSIDRAVLTATVVADDKIYDGTTAATTTLSIIGGLVNGEAVGATGVATFNSKDVAAANLVTVNGTSLVDGNNGGLASNYSLAVGQTVVAHITAKALTVVDQVALHKVYDGTTTATLSGGSLVGLIAGETVVLNEAGTFATANVGSAIAVTAADSLSGEAAANYTVAQPSGLAANITAPVQPEVPPVPELPPAPELPPTPELPPAPEFPPAPELPPMPDIPPVDVISTPSYTGAVGHVAANYQIAPADAVSAPLSLSPPVSGAGSMGSTTYDLAGLNLTVIARDANPMPGVQPQDASDDKRQ
jgi:filamentous hemagglutinin family protein